MKTETYPSHPGHPAWDTAYMAELCAQGAEAQGAVEALEIVLLYARPFELRARGSDEWDYLHKLAWALADDPGLARTAFEDEAHALAVGLELGYVQGLHGAEEERSSGSTP